MNPPQPDEAISLLKAFNILLRHRRMILVGALLALAATTIIIVAEPRRFASTSSFMPTARKSRSGIPDFAAQFGLSLPTGDAAESPTFYVGFLQSDELLGATVESQFNAESAGTTGRTLIELYEVDAESAPLRRDAAIRKLRNAMSASAEQRTGVVRLTVLDRDPALARQINERMLVLLDSFSLARRRQQATPERSFAERQVADAQRDLRAAEERHLAFLIRNRNISNSPELRFEEERLSREVSMRQQLYTALAQSYEQARLEEVRDTPFLTLIEQPDLAVRPEPRRLALKGILALIIGTLGTSVLVFLRHQLREQRGGADPDALEFATLWRESIRDVSRPWRLLLPRRRPSA